ncbi:MAG: hypothetical protein PVF73_04945 [Bacteroidales bacterium]|jgi:hypothetical protein
MAVPTILQDIVNPDTKNMISELIAKFKDRKSEWDKYRHLFSETTVPSRTILIREGETSKNIYFIKKGCLRLWLNHHGKDVTFHRVPIIIRK